MKYKAELSGSLVVLEAPLHGGTYPGVTKVLIPYTEFKRMSEEVEEQHKKEQDRIESYAWDRALCYP